jgi:outer membrane protein OmpA-like peptidoglycan-associated protein
MSLGLLFVAAAAAQSAGLDAYNFRFAQQGNGVLDPVALWRAQRQVGFATSGQLGYTYTAESAVTVTQYWPGRTPEVEENVLLDKVSAMHLGVAFSPHERVQVALQAPLFMSAAGSLGVGPVAYGDLRLSVPVGLVLPGDAGGFALSAIPHLDVPIGSATRLLGNGTVAGGGTVAAGYGGEKWTTDANLGFNSGPKVLIDQIADGSRLTWGAGGGYAVLPWLGVRAEALFAAALGDGEWEPGTGITSEALGSVRGNHGPVQWTVGGGGGLTGGIGSPAYRLFASVGFMTAPNPTKDTDGDGIYDRVDVCVRDPETPNNYQDDDGCPDAIAALTVRVLSPEGRPLPGAAVYRTDDSAIPGGRLTEQAPGSQITGRAAADGFAAVSFTSPALAEGDNELTVTLDWLPGTVEVLASDEAGNPVDAKISWTGPVPHDPTQLGADGEERLVLHPGAWQLAAEAPGLSVGRAEVHLPEGPGRTIVDVVLRKPKVELRKDRIAILEPVHFAYDKADILPDSYAVLDAVAQVLLENPQILAVEVQGHTDSDGNDRYNRDLSQRRVNAVEVYLIAKGIDTSRLVPKGYGESKPIAPNDTDEGRAQNRRVEFKITRTR